MQLGKAKEFCLATYLINLKYGISINSEIPDQFDRNNHLNTITTMDYSKSGSHMNSSIHKYFQSHLEYSDTPFVLHLQGDV